MASREDSSRDYLHSNRVGFGRCLGRGGRVNLYRGLSHSSGANLCHLAEN